MVIGRLYSVLMYACIPLGNSYNGTWSNFFVDPRDLPQTHKHTAKYPSTLKMATSTTCSFKTAGNISSSWYFWFQERAIWWYQAPKGRRSMLIETSEGKYFSRKRNCRRCTLHLAFARKNTESVHTGKSTSRNVETLRKKIVRIRRRRQTFMHGFLRDFFRAFFENNIFIFIIVSRVVWYATSNRA